MSFLRHQGIYCVALKTAGRKTRNIELPVRPHNEFPPAIPQRVALQQSPPPLRQSDHIVKPKPFALQLNLYRELSLNQLVSL